MKTFKFPFVIAYADTDAGGIVYHGRYIEIAERARMNMLADVVFPNGDIGFVVRGLDAKYIKPLKLADKFIVQTLVVKLSAASVDIEQKFIKNDEIYAILNVKAAYVGANLKPVRIPADLARALAG